MGGIIENITVKVGYDIYNFNELGLEQAIAFAKMAVMTSKDKDSAVVKLSYDPEVVQEEAEKTEEESEDE